MRQIKVIYEGEHLFLVTPQILNMGVLVDIGLRPSSFLPFLQNTYFRSTLQATKKGPQYRLLFPSAFSKYC